MSRWAKIGLGLVLLLAVLAGAAALALPLIRDGRQYGVLPGPEWTPPVGTASPGAGPVPGNPATASPASGPTPAGPPLLTANVTAGPLNLRSGPATNTRVVASGQAGQRFQVVGRSADSGWIKLCCVNSQTVWAAAQFLQLDGPIERAPVTEQ